MVNYLWENLFKKDEKRNDVAQILKRNFLFETLTPKEITFVKELVHMRSFRPTEAVFRQGEVGVGLYIVVSGSVDIYVEDLDADEPQKQSVFVTRLGPDDFFGELSLVEENGRRTATALAADDVVVLGFYKPDLSEIIERNPSTGVKIVTRLSEILGKRLKETAHRVTELKREVRKYTESQTL